MNWLSNHNQLWTRLSWKLLASGLTPFNQVDGEPPPLRILKHAAFRTKMRMAPTQLYMLHNIQVNSVDLEGISCCCWYCCCCCKQTASLDFTDIDTHIKIELGISWDEIDWLNTHSRVWHLYERIHINWIEKSRRNVWFHLVTHISVIGFHRNRWLKVVLLHYVTPDSSEWSWIDYFWVSF